MRGGLPLSGVPINPKIFHITHVDNLPGILRDGALWSDAKRLESLLDCRVVGMGSIKERRLTLPVKCYPSTSVGAYVPFYFCNRSIMLYILHMHNHPELTYTGGQQPIVHLVADLRTAVGWADTQQQKWAFSDGNAATRYTNFYNDLGDLDKINWDAVGNNDFRNSIVKEGKQAEFLIHESYPWHLTEKIGVFDSGIEDQVQSVLKGMNQCPIVNIEKTWYF